MKTPIKLDTADTLTVITKLIKKGVSLNIINKFVEMPDITCPCGRYLRVNGKIVSQKLVTAMIKCKLA